MQITVTTIFGVPHKLDVQPSDTVLSVKRKIRALGAKKSNYPLLYNDVPMEEARSLSTYNVAPESKMKYVKPGREHTLPIWCQNENVYP